MLHNVLIAVDGSRNSLRAVEYAGRVFAPNAEARLVLFHILPAISRMNLNKEEIKAIDARKAERADLAGLYWRLEDEEKIGRFFAEKLLPQSWKKWILVTMRPWLWGDADYPECGNSFWAAFQLN
jgi:hypothetical protein